ncbi:hypothetical protein KKF94_03500, partial [Patescibacteria group bacterium]|nr:hypothetical protein [Patescibacteria group bacterium]
MLKKFIVSLLVIVGSVMFFTNSAQAGSVGTTQACVDAKAAFVAGVGDIYQTPYKGNLANFSCYDETNVSQFLGVNDVYTNLAGLLLINNAHAFGANHVELHFCKIQLYNTATVSADGRQGTIVIDTTDATYNNGTACNFSPSPNYFYMNGTLQASGHDGWVGINTYEYKMEIEGVSGVGQVITSGTAGYNSLNGRQPQNTALGGSGSDYYSGGGGNNGNGYFNGGSNGGSGGGG